MATCKILREHATKSVLASFVQFEPTISVFKKLSSAAENVVKKTQAHSWSNSQEGFVIKNLKRKFMYAIDARMLYFQSIGLAPYLEDLKEHAEILTSSLQKLDVTKIASVNLNITTNLNLAMSHSELVELMFGSYFADKNDVSEVLGNINDLLCKFFSEKDGVRLQTLIMPQNPIHAKQTFLATNNLDLLLESRYEDNYIKEHLERIATDNLCLVFETMQSQITVSGLGDSISKAMDLIENSTERIVSRLQSLDPKKGF